MIFCLHFLRETSWIKLGYWWVLGFFAVSLQIDLVLIFPVFISLSSISANVKSSMSVLRLEDFWAYHFLKVSVWKVYWNALSTFAIISADIPDSFGFFRPFCFGRYFFFQLDKWITQFSGALGESIFQRNTYFFQLREVFTGTFL